MYQNWNLDSGGHNNPNKKTPRGSRISKGTEQNGTWQLNFPQYRHCISNTKIFESVLIFKNKGDNSSTAQVGITDEKKSSPKFKYLEIKSSDLSFSAISLTADCICKNSLCD